MTVFPARREEAERPLVPGVIQGLRIWDADTVGLRLHGYEHVAWESAGRETVARCRASGRHWGFGEGFRPPVRECSCGLYAHHLFLDDFLKEVDHLDSGHSYEDMLVMGVVEAWGKVELHEDGFRAERARPAALLISHRASDYTAELIEELAEAHRCEAVELRPGEGVDELAQRFDKGLDRATVVELLRPVYAAKGLIWKEADGGGGLGGYFGPGPDYGKLYWSRPPDWPGLVSHEVGEALRPVDEFMRPAYPLMGRLWKGMKNAVGISFWIMLYLLVWGWAWVLGGYLAYLVIKEIWPF